MGKFLIQNTTTKEIMDNDGLWFTPQFSADIEGLDDATEFFHNSDILEPHCSTMAYDTTDSVMVELIPEWAVTPAQ